MEQEIEGRDIGSGISIIRVSTDKVGSGPRLHQHPYRETFVILSGRALFTIADTQREAAAPETLVVPPNTPHKFTTLGPDRYEAIDIHENDHFITEWLE